MGKFRIIQPWFFGSPRHLQPLCLPKQGSSSFGSPSGGGFTEMDYRMLKSYLEENTIVFGNNRLMIPSTVSKKIASSSFKALWRIAFAYVSPEQKIPSRNKSKPFFCPLVFCWCSTPNENSSFDRHLIKKMAHPLLICSSRSTSQIIWEHFKIW